MCAAAIAVTEPSGTATSAAGILRFIAEQADVVLEQAVVGKVNLKLGKQLPASRQFAAGRSYTTRPTVYEQ